VIAKNLLLYSIALRTLLLSPLKLSCKFKYIPGYNENGSKADYFINIDEDHLNAQLHAKHFVLTPADFITDY